MIPCAAEVAAVARTSRRSRHPPDVGIGRASEVASSATEKNFFLLSHPPPSPCRVRAPGDTGRCPPPPHPHARTRRPPSHPPSSPPRVRPSRGLFGHATVSPARMPDHDDPPPPRRPSPRRPARGRRRVARAQGDPRRRRRALASVLAAQCAQRLEASLEARTDGRVSSCRTTAAVGKAHLDAARVRARAERRDPRRPRGLRASRPTSRAGPAPCATCRLSAACARCAPRGVLSTARPARARRCWRAVASERRALLGPARGHAGEQVVGREPQAARGGLPPRARRAGAASLRQIDGLAAREGDQSRLHAQDGAAAPHGRRRLGDRARSAGTNCPAALDPALRRRFGRVCAWACPRRRTASRSCGCSRATSRAPGGGDAAPRARDRRRSGADPAAPTRTPPPTASTRPLRGPRRRRRRRRASEVLRRVARCARRTGRGPPRRRAREAGVDDAAAARRSASRAPWPPRRRSASRAPWPPPRPRRPAPPLRDHLGRAARRLRPCAPPPGRRRARPGPTPGRTRRSASPSPRTGATRASRARARRRAP